MLSFLPLTAALGDPFGLGTPWASAFDAIAANPASVRTADELRAAVAKGGDIRLAAGTYDLSGGRLVIGNRTVLEGAGEGRTILRVGGQYAAADHPRDDDYGIALFGSEIGLRNLTVRNDSVAAGANGVVRGNHSGQANARTFFDAVEFLNGNGRPIQLARPTDALVRNCRFTSTAIGAGPLVFNGGLRLRMEGCVVEYRSARPDLTLLTDSTITHNEFRIDGHYRGKGLPETGGPELNFAHNVDFDHNHCWQSGPTTTGDNDGEMINVQASNLPEWQGAGKVASVDGLSLGTDLTWGGDPWFAPNHWPTQRKAVYVLGGPAAGEWRWASPGATDGTVAIDRPWSVTPQPGDPIAVSSVAAFRLRITNNRVEGGVRGILFYNGALQCRVEGNVVKDAGGIVFRADSRKSRRTPNSNLEDFPVWDCKIIRNKVLNTSGLRAAAVSVADVDVSDTGLPLAVRGVTIADNTVTGRGQTQTRDAMAPTEGVSVVSVNEARGTARPGRVVGLDVRRNVLKGGRQLLRPAPKGP